MPGSASFINPINLAPTDELDTAEALPCPVRETIRNDTGSSKIDDTPTQIIKSWLINS